MRPKLLHGYNVCVCEWPRNFVDDPLKALITLSSPALPMTTATMPSVLVRVRVWANHIADDWGMKAEFQLHIKSEKGKLLSGNSELTKHEVVHRRILTDGKDYADEGLQMFDTTLMIGGTLSDVGLLKIHMVETELGKNAVCFKWQSDDVVSGTSEEEFDAAPAKGTFRTEISLV